MDVKGYKLNAQADVQSEYNAKDVRAGIQGLRVMMKVGGLTLPATLAVTAETNKTRGVHMSRLVEAVFKNKDAGHVETGMRQMLDAVEATQVSAAVRCSFDYPFRDIFVKVVILLRGETFTYILSAPGITACPCSREVAGIGHMQRAWLTVALSTTKYMDLEEAMLKMLDCFSSTTSELMKRPEEGLKVLDSQANPKFVEDVVRDAAKKFPGAFLIKARSEESIHMHDAVSYIFRKRKASNFMEEAGWML
jgi:GTP cyclohydrolase I